MDDLMIVGLRRKIDEMRKDIESECSDCPPPGYPTDKTRCLECPRRSTKEPTK